MHTFNARKIILKHPSLIVLFVCLSLNLLRDAIRTHRKGE